MPCHLIVCCNSVTVDRRLISRMHLEKQLEKERDTYLRPAPSASQCFPRFLLREGTGEGTHRGDNILRKPAFVEGASGVVSGERSE